MIKPNSEKCHIKGRLSLQRQIRRDLQVTTYNVGLLRQ